MSMQKVIEGLRAEAPKILIQTVLATGVVALIVAAVNFGQAYLAIDDLALSDLSNVYVIGRQGSGVPFWTMFWLSVIVVPGIVFAISFARYLSATRRAQRLLPILERGTREPAVVANTWRGREKRGSMMYETLTVEAATPSGSRHRAVREVTVGTPLPNVTLQSEASVVQHDGKLVVIVGTEVFERTAS